MHGCMKATGNVDKLTHSTRWKLVLIDRAGPGVTHTGLDYADRSEPLVQPAAFLLSVSLSLSLSAHTTQNDFEGETVAASLTNTLANSGSACALLQLAQLPAAQKAFIHALHLHPSSTGTNKHAFLSHSHAYIMPVYAPHVQNREPESSFGGATHKEPYFLHPLIASRA